jgi:TPR repeat protein
LGTPEDLRLATTWYQKAAKQGNAQAGEQLRGLVERMQEPSVPMTEVGPMLEKETECTDPDTLYALACKVRDSGKRADDRLRAAVLFQQAAHYGHEFAQLAYVKLMLADPSNMDGQAEAIAWLEQACQDKNQIAMLMLAACLRNGIGCARDQKRAQALLEDLAKEPYNLSAAQATLGTCLLTGDGVQRNIPRGIQLLKAAADSGDPFAQWKMAICLRTGVGVTKDAKGAENMFQQSAEAGFPQGIDELWRPASLPFTDCVQIFRSMTQVGNTNAYLWLGICYENGCGVERDLKQALDFYGQAHAKGQKAIERIKSKQA